MVQAAKEVAVNMDKSHEKSCWRENNRAVSGAHYLRAITIVANDSYFVSLFFCSCSQQSAR